VFAPGFGLRVRMAVALLLNAILLVALLVVAGYLLTVDSGWSFVVLFVGLALAGAAAGRKARRVRRERRRTDRADHITRAVSRLCAAADIPEPAIELVRDGKPLSWTTALPGRQPVVHVTTGMARLLPDAELEAVLAHELSHIGNRDAMVMTVLAAPGVFVLRGLRATWHQPDTGLRAKAGLIMFACLYAPPALLSAWLSRIVSRHRELAADRGAALLTGSPAALAAALARLSEGLHAIPDRDLRLVAAADVLHVVPARPARGIARLWATHPRLGKRIEELERLEARLQA
jgi:heat shock protein HtpX